MDRRWVLAGLVAVTSVVSGIWLGRGVQPPHTIPPSPMSVEAVEPSTSGPPGTILIHVAGWVVAPGVVPVPEDGRVGDAVAAAGGVRAGADLERINLAEMLTDGQQVTIPGPGEKSRGPDGQGEPSGAISQDGKIRLNLAGVDELERLPGVGPVLAERILSHREEAGPFEQVEDLLDVSGIGETKLATLRDHVVVP